jgi:thioredoxin 1
LRLKQRILRFGILMAAAATLFLMAGCSRQAEEDSIPGATASAAQKESGAGQVANLPMLVDLGKGTCIPCKKMKPILEELTAEYQGRAIVKVIDLRDEPQAANQYRIRLIPTQIFYDADGNEVYRHEGFMDKQSIEMKFAEMGVR